MEETRETRWDSGEALALPTAAAQMSSRRWAYGSTSQDPTPHLPAPHRSTTFSPRVHQQASTRRDSKSHANGPWTILSVALDLTEGVQMGSKADLWLACGRALHGFLPCLSRVEAFQPHGRERGCWRRFEERFPEGRVLIRSILCRSVDYRYLHALPVKCLSRR
jgi:hypothetical protein